MAARNASKPLTDVQIRNLSAGEYPDCTAAYPGLRIRVSPQQRRTWFYRYQLNGKQVKYTIGQYGEAKKGLIPASEARLQWAELHRLVQRGMDPRDTKREAAQQQLAEREAEQQQATQDALTVAKLRDAYVEAISGTLKSWKAIKLALNRSLVEYEQLPATALTRQHVKSILTKLDQQGKIVAANRVRAYLRAMYSWAIENDWPHQAAGDQPGIIESNPCQFIKRPKEAARERALSDSELTTLLQNLGKSKLSEDQQDLLRFVLHTGCRIGEACAMEHSEVHHDEWRIPGSRVKNKRDHTVYLTPQVKAILKRHKGGKYVFDSKATHHGYLRVDGAEAKLRKSFGKGGLDMAPFRFHDFRRTFATWMGNEEIAETVHDRVLNHRTSTIAKVYNTAKYNKPARLAWQRWSRHLQTLESGEAK